MSGSGSSLFGLFRDAGTAFQVVEGFREKTWLLIATHCKISTFKEIFVTLGCSQAGKATGFGPVIRGFKSFRPSHFFAL